MLRRREFAAGESSLSISMNHSRDELGGLLFHANLDVGMVAWLAVVIIIELTMAAENFLGLCL